MQNNDIQLVLIPSSTDLRLESREYQSSLIDFSNRLPDELHVKNTCYVFDSAEGGGGLAGIFSFKLITTLKAKIIEAIIFWFESKAGRSETLKSGDNGIRVNNQKHLDKALEAYDIFKEKSQSKD